MTRSTTSNRLDALRHLISSLPTRLEGYWWNSCDICAFLEHGGVNGIDEKLVQQALHSVAKVEGLVETRFYNDAVYYVFGKDPKSSTPQSQKEAASADLFYLPKMVRNFYTGHRHVEFKASIEVIAGKEQDSPESSTAREETATTIDLTSTAGTTTVVPPTTTPAAAAAPRPFMPVVSNSPLFTSDTESQGSHHYGYKLMSIDLDEQWTNRVTQHALQCKKTNWKVIRRDKRKFEMIEYYRCLGCDEILIKRASKPSIKPNPSTPGPTTSDLNIVVPAAMFTSATFPQQAMELFGYSGIIQPSRSELFGMYSKTKRAIVPLGGEQLQTNRKNYVSACRLLPGYKGDIVWTDVNGKRHSVAICAELEIGERV
jgi:hypothetical protein